MWFVYMLLCDNKSYYVGITNNLKFRIDQHRNKESKSTKEFFRVRLVYCEKYKSKHEAALREKQLKGWSKTKKQMLVNGKLGINPYTEFAEELLRG